MKSYQHFTQNDICCLFFCYQRDLIITFVDRKSRFLLAKKANNVSSDTVGKAIKEMFKSPYEVFCCT